MQTNRQEFFNSCFCLAAEVFVGLRPDFHPVNGRYTVRRKEQAFKTVGCRPEPVTPQQLIMILKPQGCCLRCGRTEDIGQVNVDQCDDCLAMNFNID